MSALQFGHNTEAGLGKQKLGGNEEFHIPVSWSLESIKTLRTKVHVRNVLSCDKVDLRPS